MAVQPHVRKCFECIKSLEVKEGGKEGRKVYEVVGMNSPERELVPMTQTVTAGGPVEVWLLGVETAMCATLASLLFKCYADMKKTKREKWIKGSNLTPKFNPNLSKGSNSNPNPDP